ncbi:MAG: hypothetical protein ACI4C7_06810, partial [Clostridia bacterium]
AQMPKADMQIKTKEEYIKEQGKSTVAEHNTTPKTLDNTIKTKQTAIRTKNTDNSTPNTPAKVSNEAARKIKSKEYVMNKQEQKQALNRIITVQAAVKYQSVRLPSHRLLREIRQVRSVIQILRHPSQKRLNCVMQFLSLHSRYRR